MSLRFFAAALLALIAAAPPVLAASASPWVRDTGAAVRLIAAGRQGPGTLSAGLEIRLDPGYKTYWRTPGDAGVPPQFDWTGSTNLAQVRVLWPAPMAFPDGGGLSLGYAKGVVFPLEVVPVDPNAPVELALGLDFAVCGSICIPAKATARLLIDPSNLADPANVRLVAKYRSLVPKAQPLGAGGPLSVLEVSRDGQLPGLGVAVAVQAPPGSTVGVAGEGPEALGSAEPAEAVADASGKALLRVVFPRAKADARAETITLTAFTDGAAVETPVALDAAGASP